MAALFVFCVIEEKKDPIDLPSLTEKPEVILTEDSPVKHRAYKTFVQAAASSFKIIKATRTNKEMYELSLSLGKIHSIQ